MSKSNGTNGKSIQVQQSTDYTKFKILGGNRGINTIHFNRLKESISEKYLVSPIIVNEKYEVIDGQHRLKVAEDLGLPVHYVVCDGYKLEDIHRYNITSKNWTMDDFMAGYIEIGKKEYEFYKAFKDRYGFGHGQCLLMMCGADDGKSMKKFQAGLLRIKNYNAACVLAEKIMLIEPYYEGWKRRSFVNAIVYLLRDGKFDINEFVDKIKYQQSKIYDCSTAEQYITLIEEIYNFKRREKVSLRFA